MAKFLIGDTVAPRDGKSESGNFKASSPGQVVSIDDEESAPYQVRYRCQCGCNDSTREYFSGDDLVIVEDTPTKVYEAEIVGLGMGRHVHTFRAVDEESAESQTEKFVNNLERNCHGFKLSDYLAGSYSKKELITVISIKEAI